jgi:D-glycero-D-manno-heptose 1,7-bisphosphate phosphatase
MKPALFLDRDGVIIIDKDYLKDWQEVQLIDGVGPALRCAQDAGFLLFIVSNQSGIGRGKITMAESDMCFKRTLFLLEQFGVKITEVYVAPEHPDEPSIGRKPSPHFVLEAIKKYDVDPSKSYFIGDRLSDLQCGKRANLASSILVMTGYGRQNKENCVAEMPECGIANDLAAAVHAILLSR